jgi:cyclopropane fatty-acyl-phospholipid synthase-like methyltransferase
MPGQPMTADRAAGARVSDVGVTRRFWNAMYRSTPTWELDAADPQLVAVLERDEVRGPGRALEVGCGTGDNAIELARRGFSVTAIDVADRPLARAREKAAAAGVAVDFRQADVLTLDTTLGPFDLLVDRGLLMALFGSRARDAYTRTLLDLAGPGAAMFQMQWVLPDEPRPLSRAGLATRLHGFVLAPGELEQRFGDHFTLEVLDRTVQDTDDPGIRRLGIPQVAVTSWWLTGGP